MAMTVALETLGCKINQYESSHFLEVLESAGFRSTSFREQADIYVVHSCSVTGSAAYQSRQLLRRAQRARPGALVVLAGCHAHVEPDRIAAERLATHILGNIEKLDLLRWLSEPGDFDSPCIAIRDPLEATSLAPLPVHRMQLGRTRAFLKVQDGCDAYCTYCVVPLTRGRSRSLSVTEIRAQLDRFLAAGYAEVVLSGIHLGQWGKDLTPGDTLSSLLRTIAEGPVPSRLRLSSLEPMEWSPDLLTFLSRTDWICPHFHVPLQNGDPDILKAMGRPYTPGDYRNLMQELRLRFPDAALGADVMVGFPGENERHFRNTCDLVKDLPLTYLHVFPYSPRPGTVASRMSGRTTGSELKERSKVLRDLGTEKRLAFEKSFIGRDMEILGESEESPGWSRGTSANYLKVLFPNSQGKTVPRQVTVRITKQTPNGLIGQPLA